MHSLVTQAESGGPGCSFLTTNFSSTLLSEELLTLCLLSAFSIGPDRISGMKVDPSNSARTTLVGGPKALITILDNYKLKLNIIMLTHIFSLLWRFFLFVKFSYQGQPLSSLLFYIVTHKNHFLLLNQQTKFVVVKKSILEIISKLMYIISPKKIDLDVILLFSVSYNIFYPTFSGCNQF